MNYEKLSLEELEELFLQQREHHYALTEAVRNSRDALASIMNAVSDKRKGNGGASFDSEIEKMFYSIRNQPSEEVGENNQTIRLPLRSSVYASVYANAAILDLNKINLAPWGGV